MDFETLHKRVASHLGWVFKPDHAERKAKKEITFEAGLVFWPVIVVTPTQISEFPLVLVDACEFAGDFPFAQVGINGARWSGGPVAFDIGKTFTHIPPLLQFGL